MIIISANGCPEASGDRSNPVLGNLAEFMKGKSFPVLQEESEAKSRMRR